MRVRYSEIFYSFQGEAELAGTPSVWLRFFGCNLNCNGFGQKDPTDESTYVLPFQDFDISSVTNIKQLPVWKYGCDSSYSWSQKYKHLAHDKNVEHLVDELVATNTNSHNPKGLFVHPKTQQNTMLCFTGGEPMLQQKAIIEILRELYRRNNMPRVITIETNGTKPLSDELRQFINVDFVAMGGLRWHWAISPKLFTVSGEKNVVLPAIISDYVKYTISTSILKFVCNGTEENWNELDTHINNLQFSFGTTPLPTIWIMPVGATKDDQENPNIGDLCIEAMQRGYNVATRNHCYVFGNTIGR
jgi:organic radical activating enzyme